LTGATRSRIAGWLDRLGLLGVAASVRTWVRLASASGGPAVGTDGLPLPPPRLRLLVSGADADAGSFMRIGAEGAHLIRRAAAEAGLELEAAGRILDFGCGCGRVARHWAQLDGPELHGCDHNPELVDWCRANLPFMTAAVNRLEPPSRYDDAGFDLVYALSVFTHLPEPLQLAWMAEFRRILRPGGLLVFTTLGELWKSRLPAGERRRFEAGELVVEREGRAGENLCTAYHPPAYVERRLLDGFDPVATYDARYMVGAIVLQDLHVARLPAG
jgi:SAM-dependent methyltransferase